MIQGKTGKILEAIAWLIAGMMIAVLLHATAGAAWAERLFIVPQIGAGTLLNPFRPKYVELCTSQSNISYGYQPLRLVAAVCPPDAELFISQQSDVVTFPTDLDSKLSSLNVSQVTGPMEFLNIPALDSIDTTMDWRAVARQTAGIFLYMQRLKAIVGMAINFDDTIPLDTRYKQLDPVVQQGLRDAALSLGFTDNAIVRNVTLREILIDFASQWGNHTFHLNGLDL